MIKKSLKKCVSALALVATMIASLHTPTSLVKAESSTDYISIGQDQIVAEMGAGWNLGNTMEAFTDYGPNEEAWGNPKVTPELFQTVKEAGFRTVRIPISLLEDIGPAPDYIIKEERFERIKEVIDYAYDAGLYVIVDGVHGDGYHTIRNAWLLITEEDQESIIDKYVKVWQQYAEVFKDYDEHIIFESMNEVFDGNYYDPDPELYKNVNAYNQAFVDTIRKSGGNNASRWLLIPGWNTNIDHMTLDFGFELPTDNYRSKAIPSDEQRIMISAHYYSPYEFCLDSSSPITQWGSVGSDDSKKTNWGQEDFMFAQLGQMYTAFSSKGYPVVIGEYCATDKTNLDAENQKCRIYFNQQLCTACKKYGAVPVYWDIGAYGPSASGLIDRRTYEIVEPDIVKAIMDGISADVSPDTTISPSPTMTITGAPSDITVLYQCGATDAKSGSIRFTLDVRNDDTKPVSLEDIKIRYYYTRDDGKWQSFNCYYAVCGCENIWGNMVRIPLSVAYDGADFYSEINFGSGAGVLQPEETSGQIQITLTKYDNSSYNQADDYSFDGTMTSYGVNENITAYVNGNLVFGTEPDGTKPVETEKPVVTEEPSESVETEEPVVTEEPSEPVETEEPVQPSGDTKNVIPSVTMTSQAGTSKRFSVISKGSDPIDVSKLAIRYYYDKDDNKVQNFWCDNAALQYNKAPYYVSITSDVVGTFHEDYLEITFKSTRTLATGAGSLDLDIRFANEDWSAYTNFVEKGFVVAYNGVLVD